jgi:hypothetical protein
MSFLHTAIFDYLEFRENLRCSLVCKRWLNVVNNNTQFMRTVKFKPLESNLQYLHKMTMALTRDYKNLYLNEIEFNDLIDIKVSLLESAEYIWFYFCRFQDFMEFKKVLDCCQNAIEFKLFHIKFENKKNIQKEKSKNKEDNKMVRSVKCTIKCTDWRVLQCFDNNSDEISELNVIRNSERIPSIEENLFLFENYAHKIKSINFNGWTNDELILLSKKGQLRSIDHVIISDKIYLKFVLDDICQHLHNLEIFNCTIWNLEHVNLNKMKTLKKLRSLFLQKYEKGIFELGITELTLEQLTLKTFNCHLKILKKFSQPAMTSMKKLQIYDTYIDQVAIDAIISLMPNLEYLRFSHEVSLYLFVSIFYSFIVYFK